jgi:hypothetical protein
MDYVDCTLTIKNADQFDFELSDEQGKSTTRGCKLGADPFAVWTVNRLNHWINYGISVQAQLGGQANPCSIDDLQVVGLNLFHILFADEDVRKQFREAHQSFKIRYEEQKRTVDDPQLRMRMRLVFERAAEHLSALPWEFLFVPDNDEDVKRGFFFAGERTELILTRYVPPSDLLEKVGPKPKPPLVILVAESRPDGLGGISESDLEKVWNQLDGLPKDRVTVHRIPDKEKCPVLHYEALGEAIDYFKPDIFHFIGHGKPGELALIKGEHEDGYDERRGGAQENWVPSGQFQRLFTDHKPSLVFLHACMGAIASSLEGFNSVARELVYAEIPAVVAMQYSISNADAGAFARKFYEELGKGRDIDEAVKAGRVALGKKYPRWEHPRFGTPVVYLQTDRSVVMPGNEGDGVSTPAQTAEEPSYTSTRVASGPALSPTRPASDVHGERPIPSAAPESASPDSITV